jgi:hypothetical protein
VLYGVVERVPRVSLVEILNKEHNSVLLGWSWKILGKEKVTW